MNVTSPRSPPPPLQATGLMSNLTGALAALAKSRAAV